MTAFTPKRHDVGNAAGRFVYGVESWQDALAFLACGVAVAVLSVFLPWLVLIGAGLLFVLSPLLGDWLGRQGGA